MQPVTFAPFCFGQGQASFQKHVFLETLFHAALTNESLLQLTQELVRAGTKASKFLTTYTRGDWPIQKEYDQVIARLGMLSFLKDDIVGYIFRKKNQDLAPEILSLRVIEANHTVVLNFLTELTTVLCLNAQERVLYEESVDRAHFKSVVNLRLRPFFAEHACKLNELTTDYIQKVQAHTQLLQNHFAS